MRYLRVVRRLSICSLLLHNANRRIGTPEELSCFTPSPVASSPIVPSPDLPHFKSPNLLRTSIVSPSEQAFLGPNAASTDPPHSSIAPRSVKVFLAPTPSLFCPEPHDDEVNLTSSGSTTALVSTTALEDRMASWKSMKLDVFSRNSRNLRYWNRGVQGVDDIVRDMGCHPCEPSEKYLLCSMSLSFNSTPPRLGNCCFLEYAGKRVVFSRIRRTFYFVLFQRLYTIGFISDLVARLKTASTELGTQNFSDSLRIIDITTTSDVRGRTCGFELSITGLGCDLMTKFSGSIDLESEHKHNPKGRRRESFDSVMSLDSFLSDPVVDWKELLYGTQPVSRDPG